MKQRNILEITDVSKKELQQLVKRTLFFSKNHAKQFTSLRGKRVGLLFDSSSLRTKLSFEIAVHKMGGFPFFVTIGDVTHEYDQTPRESYEDIIDSLDRFVDVYVVRDYSQKLLSVLSRKNNPPVINGFSCVGHPSQALADISVIMQKRGSLKGLKICTVGPSSGSGVLESFAYAVLKLGASITMITPKGTLKGKNADFHEQVSQLEGTLRITSDIGEVKDADVLYVDEWWENKKDFLAQKPPKSYRVDDDFLRGAKKDLLVMHCLPAHHDREISQEVITSKRSIVFDEAEFRVYSAMAWLEFMCK